MKRLVAFFLALMMAATVCVLPVSAQDKTEVAESTEVMSVSDYRSFLVPCVA